MTMIDDLLIILVANYTLASLQSEKNWKTLRKVLQKDVLKEKKNEKSDGNVSKKKLVKERRRNVKVEVQAETIVVAEVVVVIGGSVLEVEAEGLVSILAQDLVHTPDDQTLVPSDLVLGLAIPADIPVAGMAEDVLDPEAKAELNVEDIQEVAHQVLARGKEGTLVKDLVAVLGKK